ncbi:MAG: FtsW/RodA/SpoVE family cell cycle protein [Bifidobacteriaceae bacterium]|jgi:cell division protein FtsW (lipid II flippase)|nr:FtsW/RodA/SpoVE family cell cycle protein [Bifidobacteriaceae bacterium]
MLLSLYNNSDKYIAPDLVPKLIASAFVFFLASYLIFFALQIVLKEYDHYIMPIILTLNIIGIAVIFRLGGPYIKQGISSIIGMIIFLAITIIIKDYKTLANYKYIFMLISIILLIMPMIPFLGNNINGATSWVTIFGVSMQPSEFSKIFLSIFFASYLFENYEKLVNDGPKILGIQFPKISDLGPIAVVWVISLAILVLQHDLGTSLLLFGTFLAALYIATGRISWIIIGMVMFSAGGYLAYLLFPHVGARFDIWLNTFDPAVYDRAYGGSWQLVQGIFSLANGGITGTGFGNGYPQIVTFSDSDFIYSSIGEEFGLLGVVGILFLYLLLIERSFKTAIGVRDGFGKILASTLGFSSMLQIFVVIGGITRVMPLTGMTLPFLAAGGSSLLANWMLWGLIVSISNGAAKEGNAINNVASDEKVPAKAARSVTADAKSSGAASSSSVVAPKKSTKSRSVTSE